ncbi:Uncharacterised protein [Mycobacteroides abscessus subsp. abscessus]|uniref:hypothetical protein n=1 Tax=Mycobacteroides abscessus TaxID=36809 RepID=UPI000928371F|nr:hypothetical protein [Mycobacteroides abscessus]SHY51752.1 Uncharacterised protein [Mycobacteroides abscessus subsp. abscessus]SIH54649.1 Uncharacterised protein [Mycobacteroides abscessus subsp. abscessus]SIK80390.1 Uncharacterised protein [Mycobacteroides abscessus subsp. abscessus]
MAKYTCSYDQLFNVFGAPGIPNTYEAVLRKRGKIVDRRTFWWRRRAEAQCLQWKRLYGASIEARA